MAAYSVGLEAAFLSGSGGNGIVIEVWGQWQLDTTDEGPNLSPTLPLMPRSAIVQGGQNGIDVKISRWGKL